MNDCQTFIEFVRCCSLALNVLFSKNKKAKEKLSISSKHYGYIILVSLYCNNKNQLNNISDFTPEKFNSYCAFPTSIPLRKRENAKTDPPVKSSSSKTGKTFNYSVNYYIGSQWNNHYRPFFVEKMKSYRESGYKLSDTISEYINDVFRALRNDGEIIVSDADLQVFWINFWANLKNCLVNAKIDNESRAAYTKLITCFIDNHHEFTDNIISDAQGFCQQAAEWYFLIFLLAVNRINPELISLILMDIPDPIPSVEELARLIEKMDGYFSSNDSKDVAIRFLSYKYFKLINNENTQKLLFNSSETDSRFIESLIEDYLKLSEQYCKVNACRNVPFSEYDLRNQYVISRIQGSGSGNFIDKETKIDFKGARHGNVCEFIISNRFYNNANRELQRWFGTFPELDYARNHPEYFINLTSAEIIEANRRNELYIIRKNDDNRVVGVGLLSVNVDTETESWMPYNGGKIKDAMENIGIFEPSYAIANTILIDSNFRGFGLQKLLIQLLISLAKQSGKSYVAATVADINTFSYNNFLDCGFVDIDKGKQGKDCSVIYCIDGKDYPRHLMILSLGKLYRGGAEVPISRHFSLKKKHTEKFINTYGDSKARQNPQYTYYDGRNCQNFVSAALVAGGFPLSPKFYPAVIGENGVVENASSAFVNVQEFIKYMSEDIGVEYFDTQSGALANAEAFDVLITNEERHSMIITNVIRGSENDDVTICAADNTHDRSAENVVEHSVIYGLLKTSKLYEQGDIIHTFFAKDV